VPAVAQAPTGWGPEHRPAAVSVSFQTLAEAADLDRGDAVAPTVSPALPTLIRALTDRDLYATFFVGAAVAAAEPLALTLLRNARHEVAAHGAPDPAMGAVSGARLEHEPPEPPALRYLSLPGGELRESGGVVRIPYPPELVDAAFLAPALVGRPGDEARGAQALHQALQVAITRNLQAKGHLTLTFHPGLAERADALAVLVETLELIEGLAQAERLWLPTLGQLAARPPWPASGPAAPPTR
jgi:hypothetical protein